MDNGNGKGKGKASELDGLFDNSNFDLLQALENVDRFHAEGPEADNIAHLRTLAMLTATKGDALKGVGPHDTEKKEANTGGDPGISGEGNMGSDAGEGRKMHNSFNTTTTESFGHIYHRDGRPVPPPSGGPSARFSHHRHHSSGALADISEVTENRDAKHQAATVEDVPDASAPHLLLLMSGGSAHIRECGTPKSCTTAGGTATQAGDCRTQEAEAAWPGKRDTTGRGESTRFPWV